MIWLIFVKSHTNNTSIALELAFSKQIKLLKLIEESERSTEPLVAASSYSIWEKSS